MNQCYFVCTPLKTSSIGKLKWSLFLIQDLICFAVFCTANDVYNSHCIKTRAGMDCTHINTHTLSLAMVMFPDVLCSRKARPLLRWSRSVILGYITYPVKRRLFLMFTHRHILTQAHTIYCTLCKKDTHIFVMDTNHSCLHHCFCPAFTIWCIAEHTLEYRCVCVCLCVGFAVVYALSTVCQQCVCLGRLQPACRLPNQIIKGIIASHASGSVFSFHYPS